MRKLHQKKIFELLNTLKEAADEMEKMFSKKNNAAILRLSNDCREFIPRITGFIESLAGKNTQTAALFSEYGDILAVENENDINNKFFKKLNSLTAKIENSITNELKPDKIEVLFLPYKASMWDCLESIWLAAKDDPMCEAYVVPIPYFKKGANGAFEEAVYEGNEYPSYVPVRDWRSYNIKERCPDIIFIHNPYDGQNIITSVHPDYYSSELKKYTDTLVYSPYFVAGDYVAKEFCTVPGCIYADKVLVQSENIRKFYIQYFTEAFGNHFGNPEDKFIAAGSPKFDAVINAKREDFVLPDEWAKIIENKKVVFFNTTVSSILKGGKPYLDRLRDILFMFKGHEKIALWWRPHPLSETTYNAMRPQFMEEYNAIVEEYKNEGFGIYDDTSDLHRALFFSDAYYGDGGSVPLLYRCMAKPILTRADNYGNSAIISSLYDNGDCFFAAAFSVNALYRIDKNTFEAEYVGSFPDEVDFGLIIYEDILRYDNRLFFSPKSAKGMGVYDLENGEFKSIKLPAPRLEDCTVKYINSRKFSKMIECKGKIFFLPVLFPGIVVYDTMENKTELIDNWVEPLSSYIFNNSLRYFRSGYFDDKREVLILPCENANVLIELDINTYNTTIRKLGDEKTGYVSITLAEGNYWLLPSNALFLARLDISTGNIIKYEIPVNAADFKRKPYFKEMIYHNGSLLIIPYMNRDIIKFNLKTEEFYSVSIDSNAVTKATALYWPQIFYADDKLYLRYSETESLVEFDLTTEKCSEKAISLKEEDKNAFKKLYLSDNFLPEKAAGYVLLEEYPLFTFEDFLDSLSETPESLRKKAEKQAELARGEITNGDGAAGKAAYEMCKKEILR